MTACRAKLNGSFTAFKATFKSAEQIERVDIVWVEFQGAEKAIDDFVWFPVVGLEIFRLLDQVFGGVA